MEELIHKYAEKLVEQGLADKNRIFLGARETEIIWNRQNRRCEELEKVFDSLNINSLLLAQPAEPYKSIIEYLMKNSDVIHPTDCETRTFLHDLPISPEFDPESIAHILRGRKSAITEEGIITFGTVTPEQAFVTFSSVCFATFVKFFSDYLLYSKQDNVPEDMEKAFKEIVPNLKSYPHSFPPLMRTPSSEEDVYRALEEAGKLTVDYNLVDSYFGNVSFTMGNTLYISQTASSLDELSGHIDPCPMDNSSCAGITASSEFSAHKQIVMDTDNKAILHGHPKFAVILSMDCDRREKGCEYQDVCHIKCPYKRFVNDVPIVPGEVGTGKYGLCNTIPPAIKGRRGAIVYGHGLFTGGKDDFNEAFENLLNIEKMCKELYFQKINP